MPGEGREIVPIEERLGGRCAGIRTRKGGGPSGSSLGKIKCGKKAGWGKQTEDTKGRVLPWTTEGGGKVSHGNEKEWEGMDTTEQVMLGMYAVKVS